MWVRQECHVGQIKSGSSPWYPLRVGKTEPSPKYYWFDLVFSVRFGIFLRKKLNISIRYKTKYFGLILNSKFQIRKLNGKIEKIIFKLKKMPRVIWRELSFGSVFMVLV